MDKIKFIHTMLLYALFTWKSNYYYSFTDVFVAVGINIEVSFNIECYKNFNTIYYIWSTIKRSRPLEKF